MVNKHSVEIGIYICVFHFAFLPFLYPNFAGGKKEVNAMRLSPGNCFEGIAKAIC